MTSSAACGSVLASFTKPRYEGPEFSPAASSKLPAASHGRPARGALALDHGPQVAVTGLAAHLGVRGPGRELPAHAVAVRHHDRGGADPKLIVPVRAAHSTHGSNNSSSRRGRNSQSCKVHPSESSRRREVEVEDLNSETPPPMFPRQDPSVYPSAAAQARHAGTLSPPVSVHSGSSDRPQAVPAVHETASSPSSENGYTSTSIDRILWLVKALLNAGLGIFYAISAAIHEVFPETRHVATLRARLLGPETTSSSASRRLYLAACIGFTCLHFGSLLRMILTKIMLSLKRIRVAPVVAAAAAVSERERVQ